MTKAFELSGVEAEKAEAMRRYNIRRTYRIIVRLAVVASLCYLWFPTVAISVHITGDWFYRIGVVIVANRSVVFVVANLIVGLIFLFSGESTKESSSGSTKTEPDLYDQYTTSSPSVIVTAVKEKVVEEDDYLYDQYTTSSSAVEEKMVEEDDDLNKQFVPVIISEVRKEMVVEQAKPEAVTKKGVYRRTKSETTKKKLKPVMEYRRTKSAKVVAMQRLSSEEFRLKVESFIMEKKRSIVLENNVVCRSSPWLVGDAASAYGSCDYGN